jgi:hypothetical protein
MLTFFSRLLSFFYKLLILALRVVKIFPRPLKFFIAYMYFFLGHKVPRFYRKPLKLFYKLHGYLAHVFSYAS